MITIEELATTLHTTAEDLQAIYAGGQSGGFDHYTETGLLNADEVETLTDVVEALQARRTLALEPQDDKAGEYSVKMRRYIEAEVEAMGYDIEWMLAYEVGEYRTLHPEAHVITAGDLNEGEWEALAGICTDAWGL